MITSFEFAPVPKIVFGPGKINLLPDLAEAFGKNILLITGQHFLLRSGQLDRITGLFKNKGFTLYIEQITTEPSPQMIDLITGLYRSKKINMVIAIGGGSVMDAGKAVSAMLPVNTSVKLFLEGVGTQKPSGEKTPFIAIPTTAGTGSETTKNAVLSEIGEKGYKKSLRHDNYVPNIALVDPELTIHCPPHITAAGGMDALTQLIESYLSPSRDEITASLALPAIAAINRSLIKACKKGDNVAARTDMAYAAMISGITLANAGLGVVHGFASPLGGYFKIPHGVVCGTLMAASNKITLKKARELNEKPTIERYENLATIFFNKTTDNDIFAEMLIEKLYSLTNILHLPKLGKYGIGFNDFEKIVDETSNKNNPVKLNKTELLSILTERL